MTPLSYLNQRAGDDWLIGACSLEFFTLTQQTLQDLKQRFPCSADGLTHPPASIPSVLIAESTPVRFLSYFLAACAANCHVFLANPTWTSTEWQQVFQLVQPDLILGDALPPNPPPAPQNPSLLTSHPTPLILIPTGGTSGSIRFAMHTWETLMASIDGFRQHFRRQQINSFCVLPLYHVSGLMQCLRSFTSEGRLALFPFKAITSSGNGEAIAFGNSKAPKFGQGSFDAAEFFLSLVPTQLQRLLAYPERRTWLSQFHTVLLGGAPAWTELLEQARANRVRLALTYGMTETASQIATLPPEEFLNGNTSCGPLLPHASIRCCDPAGKRLEPNQPGRLVIQARSLALGYYPHWFDCLPGQPATLQTEDVGYLDDRGYLHILGRSSDTIITGGEKVFPAEVEAAIRATGLVEDVCVIGLNDRHWGQVVSAIYIPAGASISMAAMQAALATSLSKYKHPKHWIAVEHLPRNAQGKVQRQQVATLARAFLEHSTGVATR